MKRLKNRSVKIRLFSLLMIGVLSIGSQDLFGAESSNLMEQARIKRGEGRYLEAIAIYREILKDNSPDSSRVHREIASIYKEMGEFKIAVEEYEKSITDNTPVEERIISHTELGYLYYEMEDFARSIENYQKAIEYDRGDWEKHVRLGDIYREIDLYDRAIGEYQDAIKFNLNAKEAYRGLASTYRDMGLYEESEEHLKKLLSIDREDVEGYKELISIYEKMGKLAKHLTTTAKVPHRWAFYHDQTGYNYRLPNINAALGCAQLEQMPSFLKKKRALAKRYQEVFNEVGGITCFREADFAKSNYWLNVLLLDNAESGQLESILEVINDNDMEARPVWTLMHKLPMFQKCPRTDLSTVESLAQRLINIPSSACLGEAYV